MENTVVIIYLGIAIVMVIAAITLGRRRPNSYTNDTTNASDQQHGYADHSTSSDSSHGDSGS